MDKSGSNVKATASLPAIAPIKDVEHGCEHLQEFMSETTNVSEKLTIAYMELQSMITKPLEAQTTKNPDDSKKFPITTLRPTFLCLQCSSVSTIEDRDIHCQTKRHRLSIESRSGCLYCGLCDDFVYDPAFEKLRVQQHLPSSTNGRKRKLSTIYPLGEEDKFVLPNANMLSCQAGAPRGMFNLGQTCYMSVILQAMIHNPLMRHFFLACRHDITECANENCIACALTTSFSEVLASEKVDGYGPVEMLYKSWRNHPGLAGYQQQDAHEYFQSMLDQLHGSSGCTRSKDSKACECLYHQTFFGKLRSTVTCLQCHNITVAEDPIIDLSLDLRHQVKKRKLDAKITGAEVPLDLSTCLKNFTTPEKLQIDAYTCKSATCGNTAQRARKHLTIKKLPPTMCIQLKRYEHNKSNPQKLDTQLNFPLQLDMYPYTTRAHRHKKKENDALSSSSTPRSPGWYDLSCVVVHVGKIDAGHYICYCRRNDQWFKFDDSKVTMASEAQVLTADAYLLFYIIRSLGGAGAGE